MKIGDRVRFLNEVGGGIIAGFPSKKTVLVTDESGFDIPVLVTDVVVVETDDYNIVRTPKEEAKAKKQSETKQPDTYIHSDDDEEEKEDDRPITFRPRPLERRGADVLNLFLAFVAPKGLLDAPDTSFEAYLINDSNLYIQFILLNQDGKAFTVRHAGLIEPNTKLFLEEFLHTELNEWEKVTIQAIAYKQDKPYRLKKPIDVSLRLEGAKFYKLHTFTHNDFFNLPALIFDVVRDNKPARSIFIDVDDIKEAIIETRQPEHILHQPARTKAQAADGPIEIDLHADEILDTTRGMEPKDILDYQLKVFRETMEQEKKHKGQKIVFIHGKGEGVLRNALLKELRSHYKECRYQDASFREYGYGATMVIIG